MPIFSSTITDLMSDKMPKPYYRADGSDDYIDITSVSNSSVGARDLTVGYVEALFRTGASASGKHIVCFGDTGGNSRNHMICTDGNSKLLVDLEPVNVRKYSGAGSTTLQPNTTYHVLFVHNGTTPKLYLNGVEETITFSITADKTVWNDSNTSWNMGSICSHRSSNDARGYYELDAVYRVRLGNHVPSDAEIQDLYSGASIPFKYKGAKHIQTQNYSNTSGGWNVYSSNSLVTDPDYLKMNADGSNVNGFYHYFDGDSFNIEKGKSYRVSITARVDTSGDNLSFGFANGANYQSPNTVSSLTWTETSFTKKSFEFTALDDGTAGNTYLYGAGTFGSGEVLEIDKMEMWQIGAIAEYDGSGISSDKWFDKSGNDFHGTVYGASVENAPSGDSGLVYEEGTWSPGPNSFGGTYDNHGSYVRVGKLVTARGYIQATNNHADGSHFIITGLPFVGVSSVTGTWGAFLTRGRYNSADIEKITDMFLHKQEGNDRIAGYDAGGDLTYTDVGFDSNQMIGFVVIYQCV